MNILLMGYYGKRNIGDDLFVHQLTDYFASQEVVQKVFVFCDESYYKKANSKIQFFSGKELSKLKRISIILNSNCLAWGGGTLELSGKPTSLARMQLLSNLMRKKFCFLGVGLEGVASERNQQATAIFEKADLLYLRDRHSYNLALQELQGAKASCLGGDLAFLNLAPYQPFIRQESSGTLKHVSFCGKFWWGQGKAEFYGNYLNQLIKKYDAMIHLLPGHMGDERNDNKFHELLKHYLPADHCQIHHWHDPQEFLGILSQMDFHIGNRLHCLITSDILGVPNIGIGSAQSKIANYIAKTEMLSRSRVVDLMEPIPVELIETVAANYRRPEAFVAQESQTAQDCIRQIF